MMAIHHVSTVLEVVFSVKDDEMFGVQEGGNSPSQ